MAQRARGGIFQVKGGARDGTWVCFIELPPGPDGGRRRKQITGRTRGEVVDKRTAFLNGKKPAVRRGQAGEETPRVAELVEDWLRYRQGRVRKSTLDNYTSVARNHILESKIGEARAGALTSGRVDELLLSIQEAGYSPVTVKRVRVVLGASLTRAVRQGVIAANVVTDTEPIPKVPTVSRAMSEEEVGALLVQAEGDRYECFYTLMLHLGLRPGECLGLQWRFIDLTKGTLSVRYSLARQDKVLTEVKNPESRRVLPLQRDDIAMLKKWRKTQTADKAQAGSLWHPTVAMRRGNETAVQMVRNDFVFTNHNGGPVDDRNLTNRYFRVVCRLAGIGDDWNLHELRHTCATLLLRDGVRIERVSKLLGHADIRVTQQTYAHWIPADLDVVTEASDRVFGAAKAAARRQAASRTRRSRGAA